MTNEHNNYKTKQKTPLKTQQIFDRHTDKQLCRIEKYLHIDHLGVLKHQTKQTHQIMTN